MSTTIRLNDATKKRIAALSRSTGRAMTDLLEQAIDMLDRKLFMDEVNRRYAELKADPEAWAEIVAERREWDATLLDGLR